MSEQNTTTEDEVPQIPATPRKASAANKGNNAKTTPARNGPSPGITPKSAPAAAGNRPRSHSKKNDATLLTDFFLGRQTPGRVAADRHRRMSLEAVKAELRHEMKQSQVRKIQPPGGVRDRVKTWQKQNGAAMVAGDPDDAATEPTDVAFNAEAEEVTEEDRIRIKMRQKKRSNKKAANKSQDNSTKEEVTDGQETPTKAPPKKRVVSDDHWMNKKKRRSPPRKVSPKIPKIPTTSPAPLPKDFTLRNAANPSVSNKVKSWAAKVEIPETPPARGHRFSRSVDARSHPWDLESDLHSDMGETESQVTSTYLTSSDVTARRSAKSASAVDDGVRIRPVRKKKVDDDGIRVTPINSAVNDNDGIRVTPINSAVDDDGIRVRPISDVSSATGRSVRTARLRSKSGHSSRRSQPLSERSDNAQDSHETPKPSKKREQTKAPEEQPETPKIEVVEAQSGLSQIQVIEAQSGVSKIQVLEDEDDIIEVVEEPDSLLDTPTKRPSGSRNRRKPRPKSYHPGVTHSRDTEAWLSDSKSHTDGSNLSNSDLSSSLLAKSIADIPGDIPFGNSAFSELDLPTNGGPPRTRPKRPKPERTTSFKSMPRVFKKVMEEGKKIIHEMNEPPKQPVVNNPPSIENWLDNTVDPFTEAKTSDPTPPEPSTVETNKSHEHETQSRASQETRKVRSVSSKTDATERPVAPPAPSDVPTQDRSAMYPDLSKPEPERKRTPPKEKAKLQTSGGLKRSRATRSPSSPLKPVGSSPLKTKGRRPFLGMLKEAFQGESKGAISTPTAYQSHEERKYEEDVDDWEDPESSYRQSDSLSSSSIDDDRTISDEDDRSEPKTPRMTGPRLRPPTNGHHELSTIMSEGHSSVVDSDTTSYLTNSTITQSTVLTGDSELSKSRSQGPGLKRRLTRHSDLVSVLSLPNDNNIPDGIKSNRSRPSLRKNRGGPNEVTNEDLLREFAEDENLYTRELKTLVDGVIPVLLSQVVNPDNATELFGQKGPTYKATALSKSVVNMGVSLEKLKNAHRIAPLSDLRRLATWAHGVVPIYHKYLDAWRLGFQDLVVNLAPAAGRPDEEDSLIGALPRNEEGDIIDSEGERVDVAHLLKRPLLRVKHMAKFIKSLDAIFQTNDTYDLLRDFENLQDKARRRCREESARLIDEDASNTDTTRARDVRTLAPLGSIDIDPAKQVSAKDFFSLDWAHSNGQRLECQVELVHRDNERHPEDKGDLLIRETGDGRRTFLLIPPVPMDNLSARTGEGNNDMVIMIRGTHDYKPWHELLTLTSDSEDQILDWLDILPVGPVPPREPEPSVIGDDEEPYQKVDVPIGVRGRYSRRSPTSEVPPPPSPTTPTKKALPTRYRPNRPTYPSTPPAVSPQGDDLERTPTQYDYRPSSSDGRSRSLTEDMRPEPSSFKNSPVDDSYQHDERPPPPPVHRTLSQSSNAQSTPKSGMDAPVELHSNPRLKRRQSSPLKHEYLPSEGSTVSGTSLTASTDRTATEYDYESEYDSSDDEIESVDLPETEIGVSIREDTYEDEMMPPSRAMESVVSASDCSLTPSNSASQAGLHGPKTSPKDGASRYVATISRWSEKGTWKEVSETACTIIVSSGLIRAYSQHGGGQENKNDKPILSLDLTPLVLIRQSTAVDLEIRSSVRPECQLASSINGGNFRFRCHNSPDCFNLYMSVHHARLNNQKFIELENEARFKSFGERRSSADNDETSSHRRSWFGRKNSYRGSVRAPSQSHDGASTTPSSSLSASSFLKRLTGGGNLPFNLARSSVDRQSRGGGNSLYAGSSSNGFTTPRSPSISLENSARTMSNFGTEDLKIRLHLLVSSAKWEDYGNCNLQIRKPPPGWHQALRANHGLEKRITITTIPKKDSDKPKTVLDAVLGSGCFTPMGSRGIVCGVWEELRDGNGIVGVVPATGATGGNVKKWCFQCASVAEASWVLRLVHQEVLRA